MGRLPAVQNTAVILHAEMKIMKSPGREERERERERVIYHTEVAGVVESVLADTLGITCCNLSSMLQDQGPLDATHTHTNVNVLLTQASYLLLPFATRFALAFQM